MLGKNRFEPFVFEAGKSPPNACYEETAIFHLICIGSIVAAVVFSPSEPYSRNFSNSKIHIQILITKQIKCKQLIKYL